MSYSHISVNILNVLAPRHLNQTFSFLEKPLSPFEFHLLCHGTRLRPYSMAQSAMIRQIDP
jgi:hypothetical protein